MATATLSKVGNSAAVFIPAAMRRKAGIATGDAVEMESPRDGVIVLTFPDRKSLNKLDELDAIEGRIQARSAHAKKWDSGRTADDLIDEAKEDRARELDLA